MQLQSSDHPGMILVSTPLDGNNYLSWSRSMKIALGAKNKLGFIDGRCEKPEEGSNDFEKWNRVNCMITSWILNSISKEIVDAFLYTATARDLWLDIEERFGECNGPLLYQLQREISSITQGNLSVMKYYTKIKKLWDELSCLMPIPQCNCGVAKGIADLDCSTKLIQFLMGLNESFDHVKSQILMMEPLPSANKAYSMILRVEKQREVNVNFSDMNKDSAMLARFQNTKKNGNERFQMKKKGIYDKSEIHCGHCNRNGHTKDACFKLHGYPDWYKELAAQKGKGGTKVFANMVDSPLTAINEEKDNKESGLNNDMVAEIVKQEIVKLMKGKGIADPTMINFAHLNDFADG